MMNKRSLCLLLGLLAHQACALPAQGGDESLDEAVTFTKYNFVKDGEESSYTGYKVLAVVPNSESQVAWLASFKINNTFNCSLDWWSEPSLPSVTVSLSVSPTCLDELVSLLKSEGLSVRVTIPDLEQLIALEKNYRFLSQLYRDPYRWNDRVYHNLQEINERINWMVERHANLLSTEHLATTYEGRKIEVIVVRQAGPVTKPVIWIDCGIHAREWVSPPTCLHAIERLIDGVNAVDPQENLLAVYDFYILPVANPDGYVYSWTSDRMWRKNRRPIAASEKLPGAQSWGWGGQSTAKCDYGVDPNRNFPINFFGQGASRNPCDDSYHGTEPFSEAESIATRNGIQMMQQKYGKDRIAAFVSIHAYSQFWMSPYGNFCIFPQKKSLFL